MDGFIRAIDLKKVYYVGNQKIEAVRGVSLQVERGDFIVILGHSGSGKTTLISMIGGLTRPSSGNVFIEGINLWALGDKELSLFRNKKIGFIFQSFSLLPSLNVLNNVVVPAIFSKKAKKDRKALQSRAHSILSDLNMVDKMNSYPSELSGGEQRRVAIARALINDPDIILADEPTSELDIRTEYEVIEIFQNINEAYKKTIIVVSHTLSWAQKAKKVIVMKDGLIYDNIADPVETLMGGMSKRI